MTRRIAKINAYFDDIYSSYPQKIPYTNAIIDLCLPFKLNVAVIGSKNSCKTSYIEAIVKMLIEKQQIQ